MYILTKINNLDCPVIRSEGFNLTGVVGYMNIDTPNGEVITPVIETNNIPDGFNTKIQSVDFNDFRLHIKEFKYTYSFTPAEYTNNTLLIEKMA